MHIVWMVTMTLFRSPTIEEAMVIISTMLTGRSGPTPEAGVVPPIPGWMVPTLAGAFLVHVIWQKGQLERRWSESPPILFGALMGAAVALAIPWISTNPSPYIYFAF
jgi:hypothetical protein